MMQPQPQPQDHEPHRARDVREAVGVFMTVDDLDKAVEDLLGEGFSEADVTLLANDAAVEQKLGRRLAATPDAVDDPDVPRRSWTAPEARMEGRGALTGVIGYVGALAVGAVTFATGGTALAAIGLGVLAGGASAVAGARLANAIDRSLADSLQRQIEQGGILLWVRVHDDTSAKAALDILKRHGGADVHTHRISIS